MGIRVCCNPRGMACHAIGKGYQGSKAYKRLDVAFSTVSNAATAHTETRSTWQSHAFKMPKGKTNRYKLDLDDPPEC